MKYKEDAAVNLLSDAERLMTIGIFVHKISLGEILQLMTVLKGDMSLVGPRPFPSWYLPLFN